MEILLPQILFFLRRFSLLNWIIVILFVALIPSSAQAQFAPDKYLHAPGVSAFNKSFDIPVNTYSGTANISIPLYTIDFEGISIPISLNYHPSGIRVTEDATWVGLGWNLEAGGQISKVVRGKDDFAPRQGYFIKNKLFPDYSQFYEVYGSMGYAGKVCDSKINNIPNDAFDPSTGQMPFTSYNFLLNGVSRDYYSEFVDDGGADFESDLYNLSIPGYSAQFFFDKDGKLLMIEKKDLKIEVNSTYCKVTTPDGFIYEFRDVLYGDNYTGGNTSYISSWLLTSITNPQKTNSIKFTYSATKQILQYSYGKTKLHILSSSVACPTESSDNPVSISGCDEKYLSSITFNNNTISFETSAREDLENAQKLDKIKIVNSNNEVIKSFQFAYNYFDSPGIGDYERSVTAIGKISNKRLKLDELIEEGKPAHKFKYTTNTLPNKTSFSQDFWGYYNDRGNSDLVPTVLFGNIEYKGANRDPNPSSVTVGLLNEIIYPTGGSTKFTYGANKVMGYKKGPVISISYAEGHNYIGTDALAIDRRRDLKLTVNIFIYDYKKTLFVPNSFISVALIRKNGLGTPIYINCPLKADPYNSANLVVDEPSISVNGKALRDNLVSLEQGFYETTRDLALIKKEWGTPPPVNLTPIPNDDRSVFSVSLSYQSDPVEAEVTGPGVRIEKIVSSDNVTGKKVTKFYEYEGGILLNEPIFYMNDDRGLNGCSPLFVSSNVLNHLSTSSGSYVGYSKVTEYQQEEANLANTKTVYEFDNGPNNGCPFINGMRIPSVDRALNGRLLKQSIFTKLNNNWKTVQEFINTYKVENEDIIPMLSHKILGYDVWNQAWTRIVAYGMHSRFIALASATTKTYSSTSNDYVSSTISYNYNNNRGYYGLFETVIQRSDKTTLSKKTLYPYDYKGTITDELNKAYMIGLPIEEYTILGDQKVIGGTFTNYRIGSDLGLPDETYKLGTEINGLTLSNFVPSNTMSSNYYNKDSHYYLEVKFDQYDRLGNLLQYHKNNNLPVAYLWGYNQSYPIIKAENIDYSTLNAAYLSALTTAGMTDFSVLTKPSVVEDQKTKLKNFVNALQKSSSLSNALITISTYNPLVGITSQTTPNGITTYYEYDDYGRLKAVKDDDNNILKQYQYEYQYSSKN